MSNTTIHAGAQLELSSGSVALEISNVGSGSAKYKIIIGGNSQEQTLSGPGSQQSYENVTYPVEIYNSGPDSIEIAY